MFNLYSIAEQAYNQVFPKPSDETKLRVGDFIATAKALYATMLWIKMKQEKREEGWWEMPSFLVSEIDLDIKNNEADISHLKPLTLLPEDGWIRMLGTEECSYTRTTFGRMQALKGDDSLGNRKTFLIIGNKKIRFPRGVYGNKAKLVYANDGTTMDNYYMIDDSIAGMLREKLIDLYLGKVGKADNTNNTNAEQ